MRRINKLTQFSRALGLAAGFTLLYWVWLAAVRMLFLTLLTYFISTPDSRLQDVSDVLSSNEILVAGFSAGGGLVLLRLLYPLIPWIAPNSFQIVRAIPDFFPGLLRGALLGLLIALAFGLAGYYEYVGYFFQLDETMGVVITVLFRCLALATLAISEEFIFRRKLLGALQKHIPPLQSALICSLAYCVLKGFQFHLGVMQFGTLLILSLLLAFRVIGELKISYGAGFWCGLLVLFHAILGLPVFGNEFPGIFLIQLKDSVFDFEKGTDGRLIYYITGGMGGPLSSFTLQWVLAAYAARLFLKYKKPLLRQGTNR